MSKNLIQPRVGCERGVGEGAMEGKDGARERVGDFGAVRENVRSCGDDASTYALLFWMVGFFALLCLFVCLFVYLS